MLPLASLAGVLLGWLMAFLSLFLIMLILIQRGKGGGLTGALGGPGGQSAFGSKAGDTFTAITIVVASLWGFTCVITMLVLGDGGSSAANATQPEAVQAAPDEDIISEELLVTPADGELTEGGGSSEGADAEPTDAAGEVSSEALTPSADLAPNEETESTDKAADSDEASEAATEEPTAE